MATLVISQVYFSLKIYILLKRENVKYLWKNTGKFVLKII